MKSTSAISIVGMGYVGLCTAATFASRGIKTIGIDIDEARIEQIQRGKAPLHEPQLEGMLKRAVKQKLLGATNHISGAGETDTTFLTVGTPSQENGSIDLSYIKNATEDLGNVLREKPGYHLVVVKSTVIPGTTNGTVKRFLEQSSGKKIGPELGLCANPEFLKEGTAINDALHPDKIVIGSNEKKSASELTRLYRRFYGSELPPIISTSPEAAELVKYASNAFLATKVSFINTIANIAQQIPGVDVSTIAEAIGHDPRIGKLFLKAGPGYGGSCFHKDLQALINYSKNNGYNPHLFQATEDTNEHQANRVVSMAETLLGSLSNKRVAVLGLAFKKDTDDIREAASLRTIESLMKKGASIVAYDPMAIANTKKQLADQIEYAENPRAALKEADCAIIMTEWDELRKLEAKDFKAQMKTPNLVDARRIYDPGAFSDLNYVAIGVGPKRIPH
ncbi:MAG TPA: UDP-glucose/GDP-mannose dehydrogenase family protein [Candidatus Bathyarchaeia archaeon]|nr:UDP-glucose/GDP-mannose dehydrogenase family protein [Candidatus Bathyarchaeia archaeon]